MGLYDNWTRPSEWTAPKHMVLPSLKGLSDAVTAAMQTWVDLNSGWKYQIWDRQDVEELLKSYPQYQEAWNTLPKAVERADMARWACSAALNSVL